MLPCLEGLCHTRESAMLARRTVASSPTRSILMGQTGGIAASEGDRPDDDIDTGCRAAGRIVGGGRFTITGFGLVE